MKFNSKILVAGASGMVGSAIVRNLRKQGYFNIIEATRNRVDFIVQEETKEYFNRNKPEYVFVTAAKVGGIMANKKYKGDFLYQNLMIQNNIIHYSMISDVTKLVFLGSSCIYPKFATQPITEDQLMTGPLEPTNDGYALAKIAGIKMCEAYKEQYGFNAISLMPTNLYGPNDNFDIETSHVLPGFIARFYKAKLNNDPYVECWRLFVFDQDLPENFSFIENQKLRYEYGVTFYPSVDRGKCIDFEYERIPENVKKEYIPIFQKLKSCVNPKINLIVEDFSKNFDQDTVSVHIRTWCDSPERNSTYHSIDKYIELMNEYPKNNFFVCSDSIDTIDHLKNIFGEDRIITYSHVEENIDCFVELLLLSKNNFLIGSPISTFSEVAWWFSECKSEVKIAWK